MGGWGDGGMGGWGGGGTGEGGGSGGMGNPGKWACRISCNWFRSRCCSGPPSPLRSGQSNREGFAPRTHHTCIDAAGQLLTAVLACAHMGVHAHSRV